ncbi:MAG TPA: hypothetical protein VMN78_00225 [Longimicrobiales bacterium]|nr:hypothetical protein [Longimicrobiales bacterium]
MAGRTGPGVLMVGGLILSSLWASRAAGQTREAEALELMSPTGPYAVGTWRVAMTDSSRGEPHTPDAGDRRALVVQFWYPAPSEAGAVPSRDAGAVASYMDTATARTWVERHRFPAGFERRVRSHAVPSAVAASGRHPTLVFSHGLSWPVLMYQTYLEDLASHGYVVAAVNHPYGSDMVVYPGGRRVEFDFFPAGSTQAQRDSVLVERVGLWVADLRFVADRLPALDRSDDSPVAGTMDLERLGVLGHSYGGSAAALLLVDDERFAAGLAMEGLVRDSATRPLRMPRPFMHIVGGFNREEMAGTQYRAGDAPYYEVIVDGMWHAMFSDLILLYAALAADDAWRARHRHEITPERGLAVTRELVRAFFDRWLKGEDSVLLHPWWEEDPSAATSPYPEVELRIDF